MKKKTLLLLIFIVVFLGAWTLPIFPDPYYHETKVTFAQWVLREIEELRSGER